MFRYWSLLEAILGNIKQLGAVFANTFEIYNITILFEFKRFEIGLINDVWTEELFCLG